MGNANYYRKESIVFTTIDVINDQGICAVSTKEVAKRLGISEGTIFNYFPTKSDLMAAVIDHFSQYDSEVFQSANQKNMKPLESIANYLDYLQNYPAITALTQVYDILTYNPQLNDKVKKVFFKRTFFIEKTIKEAQSQGIIRKDIDSVLLADIIASTIRGVCLKWRISESKFSLRDEILKAIELILNTIKS